MSYKRAYIHSLVATKNTASEEQGVEPSNKIILLTSYGLITGTLLEGIELPEPTGDEVEDLSKIMKENKSGVNIFDLTRFATRVIYGKSIDRTEYYRQAENVELKDVVVNGENGTHTFNYFVVFADQIIGCMALD